MGKKGNAVYANMFSEFVSGATLKELSEKYSISSNVIRSAFLYNLRLDGGHYPKGDKAKFNDREARRKIFKKLNLQRKLYKKKIKIYKGIVFNRVKLGYYRDIKGNAGFMHRFIWESVRGPIPVGYQIHHINGKTGDNRITNLECLTPKEHRQRHSRHHKKIVRRPNSGTHKYIIRRSNKVIEPQIDIPEQFRWNNSPQVTNQTNGI